jgi:hypothetical protein
MQYTSVERLRTPEDHYLLDFSFILSQTGPLILAIFGYGQDMRHSIPHFGHVARSASSAGRNLAKQLKQRTSPILSSFDTLASPNFQAFEPSS